MGWKDDPLTEVAPKEAPKAGKWQSDPEVSPSTSKPLPANAGLAELIARVGGVPADAIENALNLGIAGYGTIAAALGRPDLAPEPLRGSFGGSESIRKGLRATGEPGLSPDNPNPQSPSATAEYEFVAR